MEIIAKHNAPSANSTGIGGFGGRLWSTEDPLKGDSLIYEHDIDTMEVIATYDSPGLSPSGIGGMNGRLYSVDNIAGKTLNIIQMICPLLKNTNH